MKLTFLLMFYSSLCFSDDGQKVLAGHDPQTDNIAENYEAGAYLIYDCKEKHWTCVMGVYYEQCAEKRNADLSQLENPYHSCAPVEVFPNKKSCFQRQLYLVTHNHGARFCIKDSWKKLNVEEE